MTSRALLNWNTNRATRLDRLVAAHRTLRGVDRRWITDELNHSLVLRLASEFQGFARELHDETSRAVVSMIAPNNVAQQNALRLRGTTVVRRADMEARPRVGERVRFPFGLDELEGEVYRVEGKGELTWVTIEFYLDGSSEPTLNTFLLREIQPAQAA